MAFNAGTVKGTLELNTQKFRRSVDKASKGFQKLGKSAQATGKKLRSMAPGFKSMALGAAGLVAGAAAAGLALRKLVRVLKTASAAQQEYETSVQRLRGSLITQGAPAISEITTEMEKFATVIQDTTALGDTEILDTAQALASFGADPSKLQGYTKAVLDTAQALNLDAKTAARAFGQALAGNAATLGRYIPALRGMTQEQLKAGAAFDKATEAFGGFAEIAAQTTAGALAQMSNAYNDLRKRVGAAVNEFVGPIAEQLRDTFRELVDNLDDSSEGYRQLVESMRGGFEAAVSVIRFLVATFFQVRLGIADILTAVAVLKAGWLSFTIGLDQGINNFQMAVLDIIRAVAEFVAAIPGLSDGVKQAVQNVADFFQKQVDAQKDANAELEKMGVAAAAVVEQRKKEKQLLEEQLGNIQRNVQTENALLNAVTGVYNLKVKESTLEKALRERREQEAADKLRLQKLAQEHLQATKDRLQHLREINGVTGPAYADAAATKNATEGIADAAGRAADNVGDMANEFGRAASGAGQVAAATASAAGGGDGGGDGFLGPGDYGRGPVSRSAMDFSDPFRAISQAQQAETTLGRISSGGKSVYVGMAGVNAARAFADGVKKEAQASVDRAIGEYTATIISELNAAGLMDPAERSRIVRERIQEAQRLGIIPSPAALQIGAGVLR